MLRRAVGVVVATAVLAGALAACSTGGSAGDRLTIYSGRQQELISPLLEDFSDQTGVGIDVRYGDSADLALLIDEEGDRTPADVFMSQSPGAVGFLDAKDRLAELPANVLDKVDQRFRSPDGRWLGISGRVRVLVYNTETVDPSDLPQSVFDLTEPQYRGEVGVAPTNASFQDFVTAMRELAGDDRTLAWLQGMEANSSPTYANNIAIVDAVGRGEISFGIVNHYYNEEAKAADPDVPSANYLFPNGDLGSLVLVTAVGVLDSAGDRKGDAERFVRFLQTSKAQEFYARQTKEYPLTAGVAPVVQDLPGLSEIQSPSLDLGSLGGQLTRTKELIEQSGLEQG
jgi:iron(III) transport system substrate-binding protein